MRVENNGQASFGQALTFFREKRSVTQEQLAEASGVSRSYIAKLESEQQRVPGLGTVEKLARALGIKLQDFADAQCWLNISSERLDALERRVSVLEIRLRDSVGSRPGIDSSGKGRSLK